MIRLGHVYYNILFKMEKQFSTGLKLKNSLTNKIEDFIPRNGNKIKWYTCGPTVYSSSHMGHARNYLCNDMIRRVLRDYFGYDVQLCMNITDVDDKIINNSLEQNMEYFEFAQKWEADFFQDMTQLGVELPDSLTRVTEYISEIVAFIQKIIDNKYAYESNGSVYFDLDQYQKKFKYGKLKRISEAETEEEEKDQKNQKKNKGDFALWKAAKPNQPKWASPWGEGRPGWHIECSAMACSILGQKLDIHSGGIDLIFPHHENELAQSQAYFNQPDWTKYFIHVGHLHIKDCKMSKSLKNFISIKQLLKHFQPRLIRLYFFMHRYDNILNYDPQTSLKQVNEKDKRYKNFFATLRTAIRDLNLKDIQKFTVDDQDIIKNLQQTKQRVNQGFCNNIDTPKVLKQMDEIIKKINIYQTKKDCKLILLKKVYTYLIKIFTILGLNYQQTQSNTASKDTQILNSITKFRDSIRQNAKSDFKKILDICDKFRDYDMVQLDIRLEDKKVGQPSTWKYQSKQILIKQRQAKIEAKKKKQEEQKAKQQEKLQKMKINPREMFLKEQRWTKFDQNGIPTHQKDKEGEKKINDKLINKLNKEWNAQNQAYKKYIAQHQPK